MVTIGKVAEITKISISTLRYYDKEGLFPDLKRVSGIRQFSKSEIDTIRVIECLKQSGLKIKDIKKFMLWCSQGDDTLQKRRQLFETQKKTVKKKIDDLKEVLNLLEYKCYSCNE
ncbi:MAG: MerR family transcriptional regulator, partial [Oenococcus oeni]